jgi:hypothetical protein
VVRPTVGRRYQGPSWSAQGPCEPASLSAVGIFSPLHQATGLRRFSQLFYGSLHSAQFLLDQRCDSCLRFLAGRSTAALGLQDLCIRRDESSGGLLATSFGGLQHFHGPHILYGRPSPQFCVNFLSVFVLFMLDVLAHILVFGSIQHVHASYIYVLCLPAPPFSSCISVLRISLFSSYVYPPLCVIYLEGY